MAGDLRQAIGDATTFCWAHCVRLADMESLSATVKERLFGIGESVDAQIAPDELGRDFITRARVVRSPYAARELEPSTDGSSGSRHWCAFSPRTANVSVQTSPEGDRFFRSGGLPHPKPSCV